MTDPTNGMIENDTPSGTATPVDCLEVRELLPWFATGKLPKEQDAWIAGHLSDCPRCQQELVEVLRLQHAVSSEIAEQPSPSGESWRRIRSRAFASEITEIDVGTLLLGFQLGIRASHKRSSLDGSLRVLGKTYRVLGHSTPRRAVRTRRAEHGDSLRQETQHDTDKEGLLHHEEEDDV